MLRRLPPGGASFPNRITLTAPGHLPAHLLAAGKHRARYARMIDPRLQHTLTRRQTLQYSGLALAAIPLWQLLGAQATLAVATPLTDGETRAGEWSLADTITAFATDSTFQFAAPYAFGALGAHWAVEGGEDVHFAISSSADGDNWEPWRITHLDTHRPDPDRVLGVPIASSPNSSTCPPATTSAAKSSITTGGRYRHRPTCGWSTSTPAPAPPHPTSNPNSRPSPRRCRR